MTLLGVSWSHFSVMIFEMLFSILKTCDRHKSDACTPTDLREVLPQWNIKNCVMWLFAYLSVEIIWRLLHFIGSVIVVQDLIVYWICTQLKFNLFNGRRYKNRLLEGDIRYSEIRYINFHSVSISLLKQNGVKQLRSNKTLLKCL